MDREILEKALEVYDLAELVNYFGINETDILELIVDTYSITVEQFPETLPL